MWLVVVGGGKKAEAGTWEEDGSVSRCGERSDSETLLGPFPSPVAAHSAPSWGGVT